MLVSDLRIGGFYTKDFLIKHFGQEKFNKMVENGTIYETGKGFYTL